MDAKGRERYYVKAAISAEKVGFLSPVADPTRSDVAPSVVFFPFTSSFRATNDSTRVPVRVYCLSHRHSLGPPDFLPLCVEKKGRCTQTILLFYHLLFIASVSVLLRLCDCAGAAFRLRTLHNHQRRETVRRSDWLLVREILYLWHWLLRCH
jgi:hypothetical protein